jgi:NAD(P)-dependent dehydrogenase (short-subunit alcohol dehydrogenase family)
MQRNALTVVRAPRVMRSTNSRLGGSFGTDGRTVRDRDGGGLGHGARGRAAAGAGRSGRLRRRPRRRAAVEALVDEIATAGGRAFAIEADLRSPDASRTLVRRTEEALGPIDFLWNHVGHPGPAAIEDLDLGDWSAAIDLNLTSPLLTSAAALKVMKARWRGALLFTASTSGLLASSFSPVYSSAKFGVIGLAKGLAKRYARDGIRVNALCPGPVDTPMLRVFVNRPDQPPSGVETEQLVRQFSAATAMGRAGRPEEIAAAALFLLSDEASFITGVALPVDGGLTA